MFGYYLKLALSSLRCTLVLTALTVLAIVAGIGACMTALTMFRAMAADPIPGRSAGLFAVQIDNNGPAQPANTSDHLPQLDVANVAIAITLSIVATLLAGLYPTWRATRMAPAYQLKVQ